MRQKGHVPLASYYTERGESPGVWIGSGLAGIDGLQAGDPVTAEQMQALFGVGLHPLATQRQQQLQGPTNRPRLSGGDPAGGAVQDLRQRHPAISGRGRQADRRTQCGGRPAQGLAGATQRTGADTHRGGDASSSPPSTAGHRRMRANWPPRSPNTHGHKQPRSPATT